MPWNTNSTKLGTNRKWFKASGFLAPDTPRHRRRNQSGLLACKHRWWACDLATLAILRYPQAEKPLHLRQEVTNQQTNKKKYKSNWFSGAQPCKVCTWLKGNAMSQCSNQKSPDIKCWEGWQGTGDKCNGSKAVNTDTHRERKRGTCITYIHKKMQQAWAFSVPLMTSWLRAPRKSTVSSCRTVKLWTPAGKKSWIPNQSGKSAISMVSG